MTEVNGAEIGRYGAAVEKGETKSIVRSVTEPAWTPVEMEAAFRKGHDIYARRRDIIKISVSLACWEVISQDVAKTPLQLRRRTKLGYEIVQPGEHPIADLLWNRPSRYYDWTTFIKVMAAHLAAVRGFYLAVRWTPREGYTEIQGIPWNQVFPRVNVEAGRYFYDVSPFSDHESVQWRWCSGLQSEEVIFPMRLRTLNGMDPLSNGDLAEVPLKILAQMQEFQQSSFSNGGVPIFAISFPEEMTEPQYERVKKDMQSALRVARDTGKPIVLEGGAKVENLALSAVDQDYVKAHAAQANEVLRYYRMPPHKVMMFENVKYDNVTALNRLYVDDTLVPIFDVITQVMDHAMLDGDDEKDLYFAFDKEAAYAMDPKELTEIVDKRWKSGLMELDEARQKLGMNGYGGEEGQMRVMSGNFVGLNRKNEVVLQSGGKQPGAEGDQAPQDDAGANAENQNA